MSTDPLSLTFAALADPTRRAILARLSQGESSVKELAEPFAMSLPAVSKHLKVLEEAGLVTKRRRGREQLVSGDVDTVRRAARLLDDLEGVWRSRTERMSEILAEPEGDTP